MGILILKSVDNVVVFHAGTAIKKTDDIEAMVTSGGRVLSVVGMAQRIQDAQKAAYESITKIHFDGIQHRNDIGSRAFRYVNDVFLFPQLLVIHGCH